VSNLISVVSLSKIVRLRLNTNFSNVLHVLPYSLLGGWRPVSLPLPNQLLIFSGETESFFIVGMGKTAFTLPLASPTAMMKQEGILRDRILADATITPSRIAAPVANFPQLVDFIVQILDGFFVSYKLRQFPTQSLVDVFILLGMGGHLDG
jgi:hypothetical protein